MSVPHMEQLCALLQLLALPVTGQVRLVPGDCGRVEQLASTLHRWRQGLPAELAATNALAVGAGHSFIVCLAEDSRGRIWVGSRGGLSRLDPGTGIFVNYTEAQGLPNSSAYGALVDSADRIWVSSNRGLARLDPGSLRGDGSGGGLRVYGSRHQHPRPDV